MDPDVGESTADMLIEDGLITAVEPALSVGNAERIDLAGDVVMPGFVDTHRHTWQTPFRGLAADWCHSKYIRAIRLAVAPNCEPGDVYAAAT